MSLENTVQTQEIAEPKKNKSKSRIKRLAKNIGKKLAAGIISVGLALGAAELIFRQYEKHSTSVLFIDNKEQIGMVNLERFKHKPNEIFLESKCNSQGYYDNQEFTIAKKPGVKRIVAIADSFGVRHTPIKYHAFTKAENLEGKFGNPKWEIYNLSRNGIDSEAYLYILKQYSLKYNPDLTIIGFFCGNDLYVNDMLTFYNKADSSFKKKEPLSEKIRLLKVAKRLYKIYKAGYLFGEKGKRVMANNNSEIEKLVDVHPEEWWKDINNEIPVFPEKDIMAHKLRNFSFNIISIEHPNYIRLREIFSEMKELTNNKLAVVIFPLDCQIDNIIYNKIISEKMNKDIQEKQKDKYINPGDEQIENVDKDRVYNNVRSILKQQNIPVIDLLEPLKQGQKEHGRVYHLNDTHLNYWGNDIAAKEMRKFIESYFRAEKEKEKVIEKKNE